MPKVGDKVYSIGYRGQAEGHVVSEEIIGETSRSWLLPNSWRSPRKVPKKGFPPAESFLTEAEAEQFRIERNWISKHGEKIGEIVRPRYGRTSLSYEMLRKIAELIGYKETA